MWERLRDRPEYEVECDARKHAVISNHSSVIALYVN